LKSTVWCPGNGQSRSVGFKLTEQTNYHAFLGSSYPKNKKKGMLSTGGWVQLSRWTAWHGIKVQVGSRFSSLRGGKTKVGSQQV